MCGNMALDRKMQINLVGMIMAVLGVALYLISKTHTGLDWIDIVGIALAVALFVACSIDAIRLIHVGDKQI
jgi:hypothetical protein